MAIDPLHDKTLFENRKSFNCFDLNVEQNASQDISLVEN